MTLRLLSCLTTFICISFLCKGQEVEISGKILDTSSLAVRDATVLILPDSTYTNSDASGLFNFKVSRQKKYKLEVSSIGFKTYFDTILVDRKNVHLRVILEDAINILEEVSIEAKSSARITREGASSISILKTEQFRIRSANTANVIKQIPGVSVRQTGGYGSNAEIYVNGMSGKSIAFFLDGIPLSYFGEGFGLNVLPIALMEQIEVYKGVVPVDLGADALGGGINVVTRKSHESYLDLSYSIGSFNSHKLNLNAQFVNPQSEILFGLNSFYNHSDNNYLVNIDIPDEFGNPQAATVKRFHDNYSNYLINLYGGVYDKSYADKLVATIRYSGLDDDIQHNAIMAQPYGEVTYSENTSGTSIDYEKEEILAGIGIKWFAAFNETKGLFIDTSFNAFTWDGNIYDRRTDGGEISSSRNQLKITSRNALNRVNFSYRPVEKGEFTLNIFSAWFRRSGKDPIATAFYGEDFFSNPTFLFKNASGLAYEYKFSDRLVSYSAVKHFWLTADGYSIQNLEFLPNQQEVANYGFSQCLRYHFSDLFLVKSSYEYATRLPDETELFGNFTLVRPNPFLKPEQSHNYNLGFQIRTKQFSWDTNFFFRNTKNVIWLRTSQFFAQYQNLLRSRTMGADTEICYKPFEFLNIKANATYQDLRNRSSDIVSGSLDERYFNARLPNLPYFFSNGEVRFVEEKVLGCNSSLSAWWNANYVNEFFLFWAVDGNKDLKNKIPSQFVQNVGINLSQAENQWSISAEVNNILDETVFDNFSVQRPGRSIHITLRTFLN